MTIPAISALPTAPSRNDPATFSDRADATVSALPTLVTQINATVAAIPAEIEALAIDAAADATAPYTNAAAASAVSAAAARDLSIAAWAASMTPAETLPAISQSLHIGAIVAAKIYDTSKDSDGGAWRKRCQHTSWYSEALGGNRWIGQQASIAAAWTAAGSTTGAVFQASATAGPLTIGKYYAATSGTTATEVFRGVKAEFPAVAAIVAETGRVVIYDMTVPVPAMWMVFKSAATTILYNGASVTCVAALQGVVFAGQSATVGYARIDFLRDHCVTHRYDANGFNFSSVGNRNVGSTALAPGYFGAGTVSQVTNAIAGTVLPGAPVDPATGLPAPTIAVATDGNGTYSTTVLKNDGTVVNVASDSTGTAVSAAFEGRGLKVVRSDGTVYYWNDASLLTTGLAASATLTAASTPALLGTAAKSGVKALASSSGLTLTQRNEATPASSMVAYLTAAYNSGWMVGDVQCCFVAGSSNTVTDRSIKARTLTGSVTTAVAGTSDRYTLTPSGAATCTLGASVANGSLAWAEYVSGVLHYYTADVNGSGNTLTTGTVDGVSGTPSTSVTVASGTALSIASSAVVDLVQATATRISADQAAQMARDHLAIYQSAAASLLAGASSAITALDYDDSTDLLHVGTSTHRSAFRGLTRVSSEATPAGAITSLSASGGAVLTGGTSGYLYQPALLLRDEIKRRDEARRALGKEVVFFDYDAVTSQVAFVLPKGYTTKAVYSAGTLKRLGSTKDYTTSTDGYAETVTFGAAPGNTVWVSIMATSSC